MPCHSSLNIWCGSPLWDRAMPCQTSAESIVHESPHVKQPVVGPRRSHFSLHPQRTVEDIHRERHPARKQIACASARRQRTAARPLISSVQSKRSLRIHMVRRVDKIASHGDVRHQPGHPSRPICELQLATGVPQRGDISRLGHAPAGVLRSSPCKGQRAFWATERPFHRSNLPVAAPA